jgi:hypothetical protein
MQTQRIGIALTIVNLLLFIAAQTRSVTAETAAAPVLRGRALELTDAGGQVRTRIDVDETTGEVVLRLLDRHGTIRVKLGAGEDGSGLVLLDGATEPGVHIVSRRTATAERPTTTSITLRGSAGQQRVITP